MVNTFRLSYEKMLVLFRGNNRCLSVDKYKAHRLFGQKLELFLTQQPPLGQGLLIHEVSRSHTTTEHSR